MVDENAGLENTSLENWSFGCDLVLMDCVTIGDAFFWKGWFVLFIGSFVVFLVADSQGWSVAAV